MRRSDRPAIRDADARGHRRAAGGRTRARDAQTHHPATATPTVSAKSRTPRAPAHGCGRAPGSRPGMRQDGRITIVLGCVPGPQHDKRGQREQRASQHQGKRKRPALATPRFNTHHGRSCGLRRSIVGVLSEAIVQKQTLGLSLIEDAGRRRLIKTARAAPRSFRYPTFHPCRTAPWEARSVDMSPGRPDSPPLQFAAIHLRSVIDARAGAIRRYRRERELIARRACARS